MISSGMSAQGSSGGWSGVVSIAASAVGSVDEDAADSGAFSLLLFRSGGWLGGCVDDISMAEERCGRGRGRCRKSILSSSGDHPGRVM